jgi:phenylpyruvate tautomerase PptA (4-oxalocrotonate tautomerase family)
MPIVRVQIPTGYSDTVKEKLCDGIRDAIDIAIDPGQKGRHPETRKWIYPSITEAYGKLGAGLPTVTIDTRPGRSREQKDRVAVLICDVFEKVMGTRDVYVLLRTSEAADHIAGGTALPEWRP